MFGTPFQHTTGLIENFSGLLSPPNATSPTITADLTLATIVFDVTAGVSDGNADVWIDNSNFMHFNINGSPVLISAMLAPSYNPYDIDQNCEIGNTELLDTIDLWAADTPQPTNFELRDLIDLWAGGTYC